MAALTISQNGFKFCVRSVQNLSYSALKQFKISTRSFWGSSKPNEWQKAVSDAEKIVGYPTSFMSLRCLLSDEISNVAIHMTKLVGTKHPLLKTARGLVSDRKHSLQTRGLVVLLISKAAGLSSTCTESPVDQDLISGIYPSQRTLAEITEVIHTANLIHKGVVNLSDIQLTDGSQEDMESGNKMAVLSGDFLLANACTGLAELKNTDVVELVSSAIGDLMEAEFTPLKDNEGNPVLTPQTNFLDWQTQTFLSSGSLLAKSCQSAMKLAGHNEEFQKAAFQFGKCMAFARQLIEDIKPFHDSDEDSQQISLTSAPIIEYISQSPDNYENIMKNKKSIGKILDIIKQSSALEKCKLLSREYGEMAKEALDVYELSESKIALINMTDAATKL